MPQTDAPAWVVPVMRAGFAARAAVYGIVGGLALYAAFDGSEAQGTTNALSDLTAHPFGHTALWIIAAGLLAYALWRFVAAALDLERRGQDGAGRMERVALVVTGLLHAALAVSVADLAMGYGTGGGADAEDWTRRLMRMPYGAGLAAAIGLGVIGAGLYYAYKGCVREYEQHIRVTPLTRRLDPVLRAGLVAQGLVVAIAGGLIALAGLTASPETAGGIGEALHQLRAAPFGRVLLGVVALGLLGFALENLVEARFRIVPARDGADVETLANWARQKAREAER